jgi:hypothetical protein
MMYHRACRGLNHDGFSHGFNCMCLQLTRCCCVAPCAAGDVYQDSIQIYGLPSLMYAYSTPALSFQGPFGCISRRNNLYSPTKTADPYTEMLKYTTECPTPVYRPDNAGVSSTCPEAGSNAQGGFITVDSEPAVLLHAC